MTISSSLNAGVAGLSVNASRLAAISDNIANSATYGYRRAVTDFQSMVIGGGGGAYTAGGVRVESFRDVGQGGSLIATSNATDIGIRGRGFLPVARATDVASDNGLIQMQFATTGSFRTDDQGYLTTESGLILMGWEADPNGNIPANSRDTSDGLVPIKINANEFSGEPTTNMTVSANLPASETYAGMTGDPMELSVEYYDNLGRSENILMTFTPTVPATGTSNEWTLTLEDSADPGVTIGEYTLTFDDSRALGGTLASVATVSGGAYDPLTGEIQVNVLGGPIDINIGMPGQSDGMTQLSYTFAPINIDKDGSPVGNLSSIEIDESGLIYALFDTGVTRTIYQVPLADVPNPNGLMVLDAQTYLPTPSSGSFFLWNAGDGPTGDIISFALEESATDVAGELTDMIRTQRAYSSNAKVIQTVDEMLQETTNIKR